MSIKEFIYSVLGGANQSTDDFPVAEQWTYRYGINTRNELMKQEMNKGLLMDGDYSQTIECFLMERRDAAECLQGCKSGIYVLRSVLPVPKLLQYIDGTALIGIFLLNGVQVERLSRSDWDNRKGKRVKLPGQFGYFFTNDYLYIVDYPDDVDQLLVDISGHFENPEQIEILNQQNPACGKYKPGCMPVYEREFVCPGHLVRRVIEITKQAALGKLSVPEDKNNNAQFDPHVQGSTKPQN